MATGDIIAGLDLGTTKVCAIVAEQTEDGLDVIGVGSVPCTGLRKGVVVNIESTVQAVQAAVEQAATMAGVEINAVYAGIAGSHVRGMNTQRVAAIQTREVSRGDVMRVLENDPRAPNAWQTMETAWANPASGNSKRNTGALSAPAGANVSTNFLIQIGVAVRKKSGAGGNPRAEMHAVVARSNA